jgi:hypothetical protein
MAESSDAIIKQEIIDTLGYETGDLELRIFPQSSREDQVLFENGGLTFSVESVEYGSCDAAWFTRDESGKAVPVIALEGTDALNRKSSGNAQYQRFHHALGAVKNGLVGVYYLKKGIDKIQEDVFGMAYYASQKEAGKYLVYDDLEELRVLLELHGDQKAFDACVTARLQKMYSIFKKKFDVRYNGDWRKFAEMRSTIVKDGYVIKYAGRMRRNFTDSSQRAGHIAVGEMFLTKYYFYDHEFYYLFPKMTKIDLALLDNGKTTDKEWYLLRNEPHVHIKTMDDIEGLPEKVRNALVNIQDEPLKGDALRTYNECCKLIVNGLISGKMIIVR